jgi:hypothetical protein
MGSMTTLNAEIVRKLAARLEGAVGVALGGRQQVFRVLVSWTYTTVIATALVGLVLVRSMATLDAEVMSQLAASLEGAVGVALRSC